MIQPSTIEQARNEIAGMLADAATQRDDGGKLAIKFRLWFDRIDTLLAVLDAEARGTLPIKPDPPKPVVNGVPPRPATPPASPAQPQRGSSNVGSQQK